MGSVIAFPRVARPQGPEAEMVWIRGGAFQMGSDDHYPEERPARPAEVGGFWIDPAPVTNRDFARFVRETGWVTFAELAPQAEQYPGALPELLTPGSLVFTPTSRPTPLHDITAWWCYRPGASWRAPLGPGSDLAGLMDHPVVHVAWTDVRAYASWVGKDLPTEAEWEFAARGGLDQAEYAWGDELHPNGKVMANTWQGDFPYRSSKPPGAFRTSRVGRYPPNGFGLYDMIGNVWEWTSDWWRAMPVKPSGCCQATAVEGRETSEEFEFGIPQKVIKGGSHLCSPAYCRRYRPAARQPQAVDTSTSHLGFRCVVRPGPASR